LIFVHYIVDEETHTEVKKSYQIKMSAITLNL